MSQTSAVVPEPSPRLLTVQQAAVYLGATVWCVRRMLMRKRLPYVQVGKRFNITREDLDAWVDSERAKATAFVQRSAA